MQGAKDVSLGAISPPARSQSWWKPGNAPSGAQAALCLAGELRTLATYPWLQDHWRAAVLRPLHNPAVFMHVSTQCTMNCCKSPLGAGQCIGKTSELELAALIAAFQPVGLRVTASESRHDARDDQEMRHVACAAGIERLEAERAMPFKWVLRSRPDLIFECLLPDLSLWPRLGGTQQVALFREDYIVIASGGLTKTLLGEQSVLRKHGTCTPPQLRHHYRCSDAILHEVGAQGCEFVSPGESTFLWLRATHSSNGN